MPAWFSHHDAPPPVDITPLTTAFMRMDATLSRVKTFVDNYRATTGSHDIDDLWSQVYDDCGQANQTYLQLIGRPDVRPDEVEYGRRLLLGCDARMVDFEATYAHQLNTGVHIVQQTEAAVQDAQTACRALVNRHAQLDPALTNYQSVRAAVETLEAADEALEQAWQQRNYQRTQTCAQAVHDAAAALDAAITAAPKIAVDAKNALSSISVRIAGVRKRVEGIAPAMSVLLREFAAASSSDLMNNEDAANNHIRLATNYLSRARAADKNGNPEDVLTYIEKVRDELKQAERLIDAVPSRVRVLHEIKADPHKRSEKARFVLHDAQMLAERKKVTAQYAEMFAVQQQRLDALEAAVQGPHPDYLAYANGLDKVADFVQSVVAKMRG